MLKTKIHISWQITAWCLGFIGGVALLSLVGFSVEDPWNYGLAVLALGLFVLACHSGTRLWLIVSVLSGVLIGLLRGGVTQNELSGYQVYLDKTVTVRATVSDDPSSLRDKWSLTLSNIEINGEKLGGKIWTSISKGAKVSVERSNQVVLSGKLSEGFGAYAATLQSAKLQKVVERPGADPMGQVRNWFGDNLHKVTNDDEWALGMGILAGQKSAQSDAMKATFIAAALTHILVASGYNLTVLVRFTRRLFAKRSRLVALILATMLVIMFAGVTGMSASMLRASMVAILSLVLWYYGRNIHPVVLLSLVAAVSLMIDPTAIWGDAGWYLSFWSFAGVILLAPLLQDYFYADKIAAEQKRKWKGIELKGWDRIRGWLCGLPQTISQILFETISAQVFTLPIIAIFMGNVSAVGMLTNILVLPLLPLAMLLTFVAGLCAAVVPIGAATVIAVPAKWLLDFVLAVAQWGSEIPSGTIDIKMPLWQAAVFYAVVAVIVLMLKRITKHSYYGDNIVD